MIYLGLAIGIAIGLLIVLVVVAAIGTAVAKQRATTTVITEKYWADSIAVQTRNAETFERIEVLLKARGE